MMESKMPKLPVPPLVMKKRFDDDGNEMAIVMIDTNNDVWIRKDNAWVEEKK